MLPCVIIAHGSFDRLCALSANQRVNEDSSLEGVHLIEYIHKKSVHPYHTPVMLSCF